MHASTENRFQVEYCPGKLSKEEIESVGYGYGSHEIASTEYAIHSIQDGWNTSRSGEAFYFIRNPGLGLWMHANHPHAFS